MLNNSLDAPGDIERIDLIQMRVPVVELVVCAGFSVFRLDRIFVIGVVTEASRDVEKIRRCEANQGGKQDQEGNLHGVESGSIQVELEGSFPALEKWWSRRCRGMVCRKVRMV